MATTTSPNVADAQRLPLYGLLGAVAISKAGTSVRQLALPWYVLATTGSPARAGLTAFAGITAMVVSGVVSGAAIDRLGYKRASILADVSCGLTTAAIPLLHTTVGLPFWMLLLLVVGGRLLDVSGDTAREALTVDLAGLARTPLERASSMVQIATYVPYMVGPAMAGAVIASVGAHQALWLDAASFALSASVVAALVPSVREHKREAKAGYVAETMEGFRFILREKVLLWLTLFGTVLTLLVAALPSVLLPVYVREEYGSAAGLGILVTAFAGGLAVGTGVYGALGRKMGRRALPVLAAAGMGASTLAFSAGAPLWLGVCATFLAGIGYGPLGPLWDTVAGERTPEGLRGRVYGVSNTISTAAAPIGALVIGFGLEIMSGRALMGAIGIGLLMLAAATLVMPALRKLDGTRASLEARESTASAP